MCACVRRVQLLDMSAACPDLRVIIQMEPIEYEESYAADQCNIRLIPYNFVEKDVRTRLVVRVVSCRVSCCVSCADAYARDRRVFGGRSRTCRQRRTIWRRWPTT